MISSIAEPKTIRRILAHLGLRTEPYGSGQGVHRRRRSWTDRRPRGSAQGATRGCGCESVSYWPVSSARLTQRVLRESGKLTMAWPSRGRRLLTGLSSPTPTSPETIGTTSLR